MPTQKLGMTKFNQSSWHGVDVHILATLLHRSWTVVAGGVTMLLIPFCMNAVEQGYYFTFASILALQIFFELGMGQVVVQIVAHEAAHLRQGADGSYQGDAEHMARLTLLRAQLRRWYLPAALLFMSVACSAGLVFFSEGGLSWSQWAPAWVSLVVATAINLYLSWKMSMIEGFGLVRNIAQLRLFQSVIGYVLMWVGLFIGAGLWVVLAVPLTTAVATTFWMKVGTASRILQIRSNKPPGQPISWKRDILPFQWRIAVSWISGYFIFHLFTPLMFQRFGAVEAGRLGLAMTMFGAISTIGLSWVNAKAPNMSMLIARRESAALLAQLKAVAFPSLFFTTALSCLVLLATWGAMQFDLTIIQRVSNLPVLICIAAVTTTNCVIFSAAIFMRAHREEPMLAVSIISGLLTALVTWHGSKYGTFEMMLGYSAVTILVALPWTMRLLNSYLVRHK
jgi:hypothetical protein